MRLALTGRAVRPYWLLFGLALAFRFLTGLFFSQPGYADAYYYSNIAGSLWQGRGFREDYIWNYLSRPLPDSVYNNPGSVYWMPLTSVLIFLAYLPAGPSFLASQLPNMLISAALAPLTFYLARDIFGPDDPRARRYGWLGGLLMVFCSIYAPYFSLPDNFAPFALFSLGALLATSRALRQPTRTGRWLGLAGLCAGLAYLTRVDGLLLLAAPPLAWFIQRRAGGAASSGPGLARGLAAGLAGFLLPALPWLLHNLWATGQPWPGGGLKTLFLREYNDFFSYSKPLDLAYYLNLSQPSPAWGWGPLLLSKFGALVENIWLVGRGALFLLPLFGLGLLGHDGPGGRRLWQRPQMLPFVVYSLLLYLAMSLAFTFPGTRGSVFHSSGGLLPYIYLASLAGLDRFIEWLGAISRPKAGPARRRTYSVVIVIAFAVVAAGFTLTLRSKWDEPYRQLKAVQGWLAANGAPEAVVMVADVPAYYYITGRPAIAISSDSLEVNLELARRYGAQYLIYQPAMATDETRYRLAGPQGAPGFRLAARLDEVEIYRIML